MKAYIDDGADHHGSVDVTCVIARTPSTTWADMEPDARNRAIDYLRAALSAFDVNDVATIRKRAKDAEDKESAELAKALGQ